MTSTAELAEIVRRRGNGTLPMEALPPRPRGESAPDMLQLAHRRDGRLHVRDRKSVV